MDFTNSEVINNLKRKIQEEEDKEGTDEILKKQPKSDEHLNLEKRDENLLEESHFAKLFDNVLDIILQETKVSEEEMLTAANDIKEKFKVFDLMKVDFNLSENLCAYFYRYSLLNAATARSRFLNAFNNCAELKDCIKKSNINIISLGGGPGTDMIGFCSALQECENQANKTLNLTVVDLCKRWASFYNITEFFIREGNCGNITNLFRRNDICSTFMAVDLRNKRPPRKYCYDLENADVVLLARVLDGLNFLDDSPKIILENAVLRMKEGALLLLIDARVGNWNDYGLNKIYESDLEGFDLTTEQEMRFSTYRAQFSKAQIAVFKKRTRND